MCTMLRYHERITGCRTLGPHSRAVIWTHGCCFDCKGCIADTYKNGSFRECAAQEMADWFLENGAGEEGITISGGEPFLQAGTLAEMIRRIRQVRDAGVIVYTGFLYEQLLERQKEDATVQELLAGTDLLIDGPYVEELDRGALPARGSENQRILELTDRYQKDVQEYYYGRRGRQIEIRVESDRTVMVGVPTAEQARLWRSWKGEMSSEKGGDSI